MLDSPSPTPSLEDAHLSNHSSSVSSSPSHTEGAAEAAGMCCGAAAQRPDRSSVLFMHPVPAATLDNGLPSGPGPLGHCPAVGPEAAAPADVCRENKRSQNHRGESCSLRAPEQRQNSSGSTHRIQI